MSNDKQELTATEISRRERNSLPNRLWRTKDWFIQEVIKQFNNDVNIKHRLFYVSDDKGFYEFFIDENKSTEVTMDVKTSMTTGVTTVCFNRKHVDYDANEIILPMDTRLLDMYIHHQHLLRESVNKDSEHLLTADEFKEYVFDANNNIVRKDSIDWTEVSNVAIDTTIGAIQAEAEAWYKQQEESSKVEVKEQTKTITLDSFSMLMDNVKTGIEGEGLEQRLKFETSKDKPRSFKDFFLGAPVPTRSLGMSKILREQLSRLGGKALYMSLEDTDPISDVENRINVRLAMIGIDAGLSIDEALRLAKCGSNNLTVWSSVHEAGIAEANMPFLLDELNLEWADGRRPGSHSARMWESTQRQNDEYRTAKQKNALDKMIPRISPKQETLNRAHGFGQAAVQCNDVVDWGNAMFPTSYIIFSKEMVIPSISSDNKSYTVNVDYVPVDGYYNNGELIANYFNRYDRLYSDMFSVLQDVQSYIPFLIKSMLSIIRQVPISHIDDNDEVLYSIKSEYPQIHAYTRSYTGTVKQYYRGGRRNGLTSKFENYIKEDNKVYLDYLKNRY